MTNERSAVILARDLSEAKRVLELAREEIAKRLPRVNLTAEQFIGAALTAIARNPQLLQCTRMSVCEALYTAARLGLMPGVLNSAHLVPYRQKDGQYRCQLVPGYGGLRDLAIRSGVVHAVYAHPVYEREEFSVTLGTSPRIHHVPAAPRERGDLLAFYAVAILRAGVVQCDIMYREEIDLIRARSRAADAGPWVTDYVEMGRKTVLRRLLKHLPQTPDLLEGLQLEADAESAPDSPVGPRRAQSDLLAEAVGQAVTRPEEESDVAPQR